MSQRDHVGHQHGHAQHGHSHHDHSQQGHSHADAASHFDDRAATWDETEEHRERAQAVVAVIEDQLVLRPDMSVLEYGAGTGLVAQGLAPRVGPLTLADTSAGMRQVMAAKVAAGQLPAGTRIWDFDVTSSALPEDRFDLILAVMVLHHLDDVAQALAGLASLLTASGTLCVADLDTEDGSYHSADLPVQHGFDRHELAAQLKAVGLTQVRFTDGPARHRDGQSFATFVAMAAR